MGCQFAFSHCYYKGYPDLQPGKRCLD
uniref:Uncharacterized protein n=1 Tax=Arundo donax TaxID=35708 RepID=A0A0A9H989_ARUDO